MLRCARARAWRAPGPPLCLTDVKEERRVGGLARVQVLGQHARRELHGQLVAREGLREAIGEVLDTPFLTSGSVGKKVEAQIAEFFDEELPQELTLRRPREDDNPDPSDRPTKRRRLDNQ